MRNYSRTDASLTGWQVGMNALYQQIVDTTPAGEISDNSLEFKFDGEHRRYMKRARLLATCQKLLGSAGHCPCALHGSGGERNMQGILEQQQ